MTVTIGGIPALQIDGVLAPGASSCPWLEPRNLRDEPSPPEGRPFVRGPDRARSTCSIFPVERLGSLALAPITDEHSFETVLKFAAPIPDSIEFPAR